MRYNLYLYIITQRINEAQICLQTYLERQLRPLVPPRGGDGVPGPLVPAVAGPGVASPVPGLPIYTVIDVYGIYTIFNCHLNQLIYICIYTFLALASHLYDYSLSMVFIQSLSLESHSLHSTYTLSYSRAPHLYG